MTAALVAALNAFGWHKRFSAIIAAKWGIAALVSEIDFTIHALACDVDRSAAMTDAHRELLKAATGKWTVDLANILSVFGRAYGTAIEPLESANIIEKLRDLLISRPK